jgi:hypothetical protein
MWKAMAQANCILESSNTSIASPLFERCDFHLAAKPRQAVPREMRCQRHTGGTLAKSGYPGPGWFIWPHGLLHRINRGPAFRHPQIRCARTFLTAHGRIGTISFTAENRCLMSQEVRRRANPFPPRHNEETMMGGIDEGKRRFFRQVCCGSAALGAGRAAGSALAATGKQTALTPEQALQ